MTRPLETPYTPSVPHYLVVHERGEDYEIEHPGCSWEDNFLPGGPPLREYNCLVGVLIREVGLDALDVDWETLEAGRYELTGWTTKHAAIPGIRDTEWDAGLELGERS